MNPRRHYPTLSTSLSILVFIVTSWSPLQGQSVRLACGDGSLTSLTEIGIGAYAPTADRACQEKDFQGASEAAVSAPAVSAGEGVMTAAEAAHFVEVFDSFFVGPNPDVLDEIFAPEFVTHLPLAPALDLEAFKAYVSSFYGGVSDMTQVTNQVIIGKDRLVIHVTYYGTHDGPLFGVPATGNPITINGIGIFRFNEAGLAVENWAVLDMAGVLAQIGALPSAEA